MRFLSCIIVSLLCYSYSANGSLDARTGTTSTSTVTQQQETNCRNYGICDPPTGNNFVEDECSRELEISRECIDAFNGLSTANSFLNGDLNLTDSLASLFESSLRTTCGRSCFPSLAEYFKCKDMTVMEDVLYTVTCVTNEVGDYCPSLFLQKQLEFENGGLLDDCSYFIDISNDTLNCSDGGCYEYIRSLDRELGCCSPSLFTTFGSMYQKFINRNTFKSCKIDIDDIDTCVPVDPLPDTASAMTVSLSIIVIAAVLVAIAEIILY